MVAAVLLSERDSSKIDSAGVVVDQTLMAFDYLCGEQVGALEGAPDPMGPTGGAALYDRDAFEAVGGFDERIFLYYEDVDLALRMPRAEGARCALSPRAPRDPRLLDDAGRSKRSQVRENRLEPGIPAAAVRGATSSASRALQALAREGADLRRPARFPDRTIAGARGQNRGLARRPGTPSPRHLPEAAVTKLSLPPRPGLAQRRPQRLRRCPSP